MSNARTLRALSWAAVLFALAVVGVLVAAHLHRFAPLSCPARVGPFSGRPHPCTVEYGYAIAALAGSIASALAGAVVVVAALTRRPRLSRTRPS